jgi:hypothetical protein
LLHRKKSVLNARLFLWRQFLKLFLRGGGWPTSSVESITWVWLSTLTEITGGAPLLALFEKWPAAAIAWENFFITAERCAPSPHQNF